ncbi:MAG TPA: DUF87 domain-containing protein [Ktedonobacterales bacterium]|jgi:hypothetical protein|nr:DUF87 domain-containing protein [Ktedonobacterales bacterium]
MRTLVQSATDAEDTESIKRIHSFFGLSLQAQGAMTLTQRLEAQAQFLGRYPMLCNAAPGATTAIEVRVIVDPEPTRGATEPLIEVFLLCRYSAWASSPAELRAQVRVFANDLSDTLHGSLPSFRFAPITEKRLLTHALSPFRIADTVEFRRRPARLSDASLPLPFQGAPKVEALVDEMQRHRTASLLSFCYTPAELDDGPLFSERDEPFTLTGSMRNGQQERQESRPQTPYDGVTETEALVSAYTEYSQRKVIAMRHAALSMRAFRVRAQLAGAGALSGALVSRVGSEIAGPGEDTGFGAWSHPELPIAGGALCERPRTLRLSGENASAFAVAERNLLLLQHQPWGSTASDEQSMIYANLADMREATNLLALPCNPTWLPEHGAALPLAYRARVSEPAIRLGVNRVRNRELPVRLSVESRDQHLWVLGKTGVGKSTLIAQMALQDIHAGRGVIVIDPHGDLIRDIAGRVPRERIEDVILFDPSDSEYPVGLNPLECETDDERALIVSSFIDMLTQLYDPHLQGFLGPRFQHGARNVMLTVMYMPGGTLIEVVRAFQDDKFVRSILKHVTDPMVRRYWTDQIEHTNSYHRSEVLDWLVSKFSHFTVDQKMRHIFGQSKSAFRFREAMDQGKIVLISLGKGKLGSANANFIGYNLLPMIQHAALSRADLPESQRRPVALYIDEFQNYPSTALASMLSEARKYKVALTLANQHIGQLGTDVREAVIGNAGSIIAFRTGLADGHAVEQALEPSPVAAQHLMDLPRYTAYARLLSDGQPTPVFTVQTEPLGIPFSEERYEAVRAWSRQAYGRPRAEVDADINARAQFDEPTGHF